MTVSAGRELVERFVGALNAWDTDALAATLAPEFVDHTPVGDERGRDGFVGQKLGALHGAFPDLVLSIEDAVEEGDRIAWRWTLTGTNLGEFDGRPPTEKQIQFQGMNMEWIEDGRIAHHWSIYDSRTLFEQLGRLSSS